MNWNEKQKLRAFNTLKKHKHQVESLTNYFLEPRVEEQNAQLAELEKRCEKELQFIMEQRKILEEDAQFNEQQNQLNQFDNQMYEKDFESFKYIKYAKHMINKETQFNASSLNKIPKEEDDNELTEEDKLNGLAIWKKALLEGCRSFQLLRQLLYEQRPNSQDKWLKHVKALEEIYFRDI